MGFSQFVRLSSRHVRSTCLFFCIEFLRFYIHLTGPLDFPPVLIAFGLYLGIPRTLNNCRDTNRIVFFFLFFFSIFLVFIQSDLYDRFDRWKKGIVPWIFEGKFTVNLLYYRILARLLRFHSISENSVHRFLWNVVRTVSPLSSRFNSPFLSNRFTKVFPNVTPLPLNSLFPANSSLSLYLFQVVSLSPYSFHSYVYKLRRSWTFRRFKAIYTFLTLERSRA